jgi:hypothetical protein
MRLDADPELMSTEEREQAATALREALARLELAPARPQARRRKTSRRALVGAQAAGS